MIERAVVTGASGFVGRHLVRHLVQLGVQVTALHRRDLLTTRPPSGDRWIRADITDPTSLRHAFAGGADSVFHLAAALVGPTDDWSWHQSVGVTGTENVLAAADEAGIERFVHVSSEVVYPRSAANPVAEDCPLIEDPSSVHPYVRQKVLAEMAVWRADTRGQVAATIVRPSRVIGAGDPNLIGAMANLFSSASGRIFDDRSSRVPVVAVEDLVEGIVLAACPAAAHRAYNLSGAAPSKSDLRHSFIRAGCEFGAGGTARRVVLAAATLPVRVLGLAGQPELGASSWRRSIDEALRTKIGHPLTDRIYDCRRAAADLGWAGHRDYRQSVAEAVDWSGASGSNGPDDGSEQVPEFVCRPESRGLHDRHSADTGATA